MYVLKRWVFFAIQAPMAEPLIPFKHYKVGPKLFLTSISKEWIGVFEKSIPNNYFFNDSFKNHPSTASFHMYHLLK